jgi:hypothetical protein
MQPRNPNFARRVQESFALQGAMRTLGASLEAIEPGRGVRRHDDSHRDGPGSAATTCGTGKISEGDQT